MYQLRTRLVNFRVTEEEFERLKLASATKGARCLSDFARSTILSGAAPPSPSGSAPSVEDKLQSFERRLSDVETSLARIVKALVASRTTSES